jgi:hypothetical protein
MNILTILSRMENTKERITFYTRWKFASSYVYMCTQSEERHLHTYKETSSFVSTIYSKKKVLRKTKLNNYKCSFCERESSF